MPGSALKRCVSCKAHIAVACKACRICGEKQPMKRSVMAAKRKIDRNWVTMMTSGNNSCKLLNSAEILMHKLSAMGKYPLLLLGKKSVSSTFTADIISDFPFSTEKEKATLETLKQIYPSLLKVADCVKGHHRDTTDPPEEEDLSTHPGEEDLNAHPGEEDLNTHPGEEDLSAHPGEEDLSTHSGEEETITLFLTPIDPPMEPLATLQPPSKKFRIQKTKDIPTAVAKAPTAVAKTPTAFSFV